MTVEAGVLREKYAVSPGRRVDITAIAQTNYKVLAGRDASIVRQSGKQTALWKSEALRTGGTFTVAQGETVTIYNHWGKVPVEIHEILPFSIE